MSKSRERRGSSIGSLIDPDEHEKSVILALIPTWGDSPASSSRGWAANIWGMETVI